MRESVSPEKVTDYGVTFAPTLPALSNRLSEVIKEKGLTFKDSAAMVGISRQALDYFIRGDLQPTIEVALKLSLLLDTPVEQLFQLGEGAWFTTAKDDNGHTIFYDHLKEELLSGSAMKGVQKTIRYSRDGYDSITNASFKRMVKEREDEVVKEAIQKDGRENHTRDTLARKKEAARALMEQAYPIRYERMYRPISQIK